jgi:hypothetical protein
VILASVVTFMAVVGLRQVVADPAALTLGAAIPRRNGFC